MATRNFYLLPDPQFAPASANFSTLITATPTAFALTAAQATNYGTLNAAYQTALSLATNPSTRTTVTIGDRTLARESLCANAKLLAGIVKGTPTVTNPQLESLGLLPRTTNAPIPAPGDAPVVQVVSVSGRTVSVRLRNAGGTGRGKPAGVRTATVFSYVGAGPAPTDINLWKYEGVTTRVDADVTFADAVAGGSLVWITAIWANNRAQSGPAAGPVSTYIAGGGVGAMAA